MGLNRSIPKVSPTILAVAAAFAPAQDGASAVDSACEVRSSIIKSGIVIPGIPRAGRIVLTLLGLPSRIHIPRAWL